MVHLSILVVLSKCYAYHLLERWFRILYEIQYKKFTDNFFKPLSSLKKINKKSKHIYLKNLTHCSIISSMFEHVFLVFKNTQVYNI